MVTRLAPQSGSASQRREPRRGISWWLVAVLALAACCRLAWIVLVPNGQYSDSVWYDGAAANLASSGMYGLNGPSAWFPPGYPFFLATIYKLFCHAELAGNVGNVT